MKRKIRNLIICLIIYIIILIPYTEGLELYMKTCEYLYLISSILSFILAVIVMLQVWYYIFKIFDEIKERKKKRKSEVEGK